MRALLQDTKYALRLLGRSPGFTAAAVLALALGTGANTAIFSVVDAVLVRLLPFRDPERLVLLWEKNPARHRFKLFVAPVNLVEWQERGASFESLAGMQAARVNLTAGPAGAMEPEELAAERVTANMFPLLGVRPALGRAFSPDEDRPGNAGFAVLSHALWQRRFGGDASIIGKSVRLRDQLCTVLGVMPPRFEIMNAGVDMWMPLALNRADRASPAHTLTVIGRLRPGVSLTAAAAEMDALGRRLGELYPKLNAGVAPSLFPLRDELAGKVRTPLLVLLGTVGFLLLISCANVANLLLARATVRQREAAVRTALGASRGRLVRQMLTESVVLALAGGALGLAVAACAMRAMLHIAPASLPRLNQAGLDARVLAFTLAVAVLTGIVFGLVPALDASRVNLNEALKQGGRGGTAGRARRLARASLVVGEVALAMVVLTGAGLLVRSFLLLRAAGPGFQPVGVLTARVPLSGGRNAAEPRRILFFQELMERLAALPGVRGAGAVGALPLTGLGAGTAFAVEGLPAPPPEARPLGLLRSVAGAYFETLRIPLVAGRGFNAFDTRESLPVAIVSATTARRYWPGRDACQSRVTLDFTISRTVTVVGVVGNVKADRPDGEDWPMFYLPYPQAPQASMSVVVRPASAAGALRRAVREMDRDQPLAEVRTMEDVLAESVAGPRFHAVLLAIFAAVAFALTVIGIYGVMSYSVTARTGEIGVRMALGATAGDITRMVLLDGAKLAAAGIALGAAAALALTRLMASMLYTVRPFDAPTYAAVAAALAAVALAACYLPARRAMAVDPVVALRHE